MVDEQGSREFPRMKRTVTSFLLRVSLLVLLVVVVGSGLFLLVGAAISGWLPLSLYEASTLAIGATIAFATVTYIIVRIYELASGHGGESFGGDDDEEWEPLLDEEPEDAPDMQQTPPKPDYSRVTRNDYCPCGSGKKFKYCCEPKGVR